MKRKFTIGPYHPDIIHYEMKTIVEFYGDYPHSNPQKYKASDWNALSRRVVQEIWKYDNKRKKFIEQQGWKVIIVWQSDWLNEPAKVLQTVLNELTTDVTK